MRLRNNPVFTTKDSRLSHGEKTTMTKHMANNFRVKIKNQIKEQSMERSLNRTSYGNFDMQMSSVV